MMLAVEFPVFASASPVVLPFWLSNGKRNDCRGPKRLGTAASKSGLPEALLEKTPLATTEAVEETCAIPKERLAGPDEVSVAEDPGDRVPVKELPVRPPAVMVSGFPKLSLS